MGITLFLHLQKALCCEIPAGSFLNRKNVTNRDVAGHSSRVNVKLMVRKLSIKEKQRLDETKMCHVSA